jgi:hypothetical protein
LQMLARRAGFLVCFFHPVESSVLT